MPGKLRPDLRCPKCGLDVEAVCRVYTNGSPGSSYPVGHPVIASEYEHAGEIAPPCLIVREWDEGIAVRDSEEVR